MRKEHQKLGYIAGGVSAIVNIVLFIVKFQIGRQIGSVAMQADAWHTLSDTLTSLVVIVGFFISGRKSDSEHPFGHGRAELIGAVVISVLLGLVGVEFIRDSIVQLQGARAVQYSMFSIVIFGVSIFVKEGLAQFAFWAGRRAGSKSLMADGWHHRSDALTTVLIVAGALLGSTWWWIDGVLGISMSVFILYTAYTILRDASNSLLGESPGKELTNKITEIVRSEAPCATDIHHVHLHRYGDHAEVTLHIRMPGEVTLKTVHQCTDKIEKKLIDQLDIQPTIHCEPQDVF